MGASTGTYYIEISSPHGAYSSQPYTLTAVVTHPDPEGVETLILINRTRLEDRYGEAAVSDLLTKLSLLAGHERVKGVIVQLEDRPESPWPTPDGISIRPA